MVCFLLSEWCVATSFYLSSANHVAFYLLFNLRNLLYPIVVRIHSKSGTEKHKLFSVPDLTRYQLGLSFISATPSYLQPQHNSE